jgi:crossover junction endodeoxyribonuclease RuvC
MGTGLSGKNCVLGIDPGLNGALAWYWPETNEMVIHDIPTLTITVGKSKKRVLDLIGLARSLDDPGRVPTQAFLEDVHSMPQQGITSAFSFGFMAGALRQALADRLFPYQLVQPAVWKRRFNLTRDKDLSRLRASELLPEHAYLWPLKKHDGRAEAALLAVYGCRTVGVLSRIRNET